MDRVVEVLSALPRAQLLEAMEAGAQWEVLSRTDKLSYFEPYPFQKQFLDARDPEGDLAYQRMLQAGNQIGKTEVGGAECAYHLTGQYPAIWNGWRFDRPTRAWAGGVTNDGTRDLVQAKLLGGHPDQPEVWGTGMIPLDCLGRTERRPNIPNALGSVMVKHVSGGWSRLQFKSYEQGPEAWMGQGQDFIWLDEEPPMPIYSQALRACAATGGKIIITFTPERGMTDVVALFHNKRAKGQALYTAGWDDAPHMLPEVREQILAALPPHERAMREQGIPVLGSGLVFPVKEEHIRCDPFEIPKFWPRIAGLDFGWDHPTGVVWITWDTETDIIYVYDNHRMSGAVPAIHAEAIKRRGKLIPVAWPHDGLVKDKGSGDALAAQYADLGVNMMAKRFENPETVEGRRYNAIEPGIMEMLTRMQTGRLKVFSHLGEWFEEVRMYHRKDGVIVPKNDDLMSATRYAIQSRRFAEAAVSLHPLYQTAEGTGADYDPYNIPTR
ncbi:MAG: terminase family protein [Dehalococcoidales bacterium]